MRRLAVAFALWVCAVSPAWAQEVGKMPLVGVLLINTAADPEPARSLFHDALAALGYVEGRNLRLEYRFAEGQTKRFPSLAEALVGDRPDVIVALGDAATRSAQQVTRTIPIIAIADDLVAAGLIQSMAKPGGNLTGVSILASYLAAKRLELLSELVPQARVFALLVNPNDAYTKPLVEDMQEAARVKGVRLQILNASTESEIDAAFAALADLHADALIVGDSVFFTARREQLVALASRYAVPVIERWREFTVSGGLISYGPSLTDTNRQLGIYAGKILNGAKPADLPVQQPTTFELVVNLKTAKALALTVPPSILARADEVIE